MTARRALWIACSLGLVLLGFFAHDLPGAEPGSVPDKFTIPGKLAYYEGEAPHNRFILDRRGGPTKR